MPAPEPFRPLLRPLEPRDLPAVLFAESFESPAAPVTPAGYQSWGAGGYLTTRVAAATGSQSLLSTGDAAADSRYWASAATPGDTAATVKVRTDAPAPVELLIRGQSLATPAARYVALKVSPGAQKLELVQSDGVTAATLAATPTRAALPPGWLAVTLTPAGGAVTATLQRLDTGAYLTEAGTWQAAAAVALTGTPTAAPTSGQVGVARLPGGAGYVYFDDLSASAAAAPTRETFDATPAGQLPAGWSGWTSDGSPGFRASAVRALTPANGLAAAGTSATAARAWLTSPLPADTQATAAVFTDTPIPATVFVRGQNLGTATPSYYAATLARGVDVRLVKVVNGVETQLGRVASKDYVSYAWLRVTVAAQGSTLRALVTRADTGQWLTSTGEWQSLPQAALVATDSTLAAAGNAGVGRPARVSAGTLAFDDFETAPTFAPADIRLTLTASKPAAGVTGDVAFTLAAAPPHVVRRVEFELDGQVRSAAASAPATWTLDSTAVANGPHTLLVRATDDAGTVATTSLPFTVANPAAVGTQGRPSIPAHYGHIRIAQLAYDGNPLGAFEQARLQDSVDLVIPNPKYFQAIDAVAPATPQIVYSNVSNLYQGLLSSWLDYADRTGASRELAFYHVPIATPFTGASPSSQPVADFRSVTRQAAGGDATDFTAAATGGRTFPVSLGGVGSALTLGYLEEFREANFDLKTAAAAGWAGVWEYPTAVNADGTPAGWRPLTLIADGTQGLTRSGRVTFEPPADWVAARVAGTRQFAVRIRTTSDGTNPAANTILGRDYVQAAGRAQGTIPAFDAAADQNGDGILSDAEYATRAPGKDARFVYESRLFYPYYGQQRYAANPGPVEVKRWAAAYHADLLAQNPLADGVFLDNEAGRSPLGGTPVIEPTAGYSADSAALVAAVQKAIGPKLVISNTTGGRGDADGVAAASAGVLEEFALRPTEATWSGVADLLELVRRRLGTGTAPPLVILDTYPGQSATTDERYKQGALAYYYLAADPKSTAVMFDGGFAPAAPWSQTWITSAATDVGQPLGAATVWATGTDPANAALAYKVYRRDYQNATVLYKPRSYALGGGTGTLADATATTHQLGGDYRVLASDGTLGPVVRQVTLRNGEGVVLMKRE